MHGERCINMIGVQTASCKREKKKETFTMEENYLIMMICKEEYIKQEHVLVPRLAHRIKLQQRIKHECKKMKNLYD